MKMPCNNATRHTSKNFSHTSSNGRFPAVKNRNAIFGFEYFRGRLERMSCARTREASSSSVRGLGGGVCANSESGHTFVPNKSHGFIFRADLRRFSFNVNTSAEMARISISPNRRYHLRGFLLRCLSLLDLELPKLLKPLRILITNSTQTAKNASLNRYF